MDLMVLLGDVGEVEARFSPLGDSVNLDGTLGDVGQGEARFNPFVDSISLDAR